MSQDGHVPVIGFTAWLRATRRARKSGEGADVPCGGCTACCTASYFIHIGPDEHEVLASIPRQFLFPAPGLPKGHVLMGYTDEGHCPMFIKGRCSIYHARPRTCRDYDCRIFAATGVSEGDDKPHVSAAIKRWKFAFPTPRDNQHFEAVRAAARFVGENAKRFPPGFIPDSATQQALLAVKVYEVFMDPGALDPARVEATVDAVVAVCRRFSERA